MRKDVHCRCALAQSDGSRMPGFSPPDRVMNHKLFRSTVRLAVFQDRTGGPQSTAYYEMISAARSLQCVVSHAAVWRCDMALLQRSCLSCGTTLHVGASPSAGFKTKHRHEESWEEGRIVCQGIEMGPMRLGVGSALPQLSHQHVRDRSAPTPFSQLSPTRQVLGNID
jgi:hypothetical protein